MSNPKRSENAFLYVCVLLIVITQEGSTFNKDFAKLKKKYGIFIPSALKKVKNIFTLRTKTKFVQFAQSSCSIIMLDILNRKICNCLL